MKPEIPPLDKIDIRLLRVFKTVTECGGFSAAEEVLNIGRSTISIHISDLETRFGLRLCTRGPSGFSLTKHGEVVYEATLKLFNAINNFRSTVGSSKGKLMGELSIWIMDNTSTDPFDPFIDALKRFRQRPSEVQFQIQVAPPADIERAVHDGRCAIGLTGSKTDFPDLQYDYLHSEENTLYCGRAHPIFELAASEISDDMLQTADFARRGVPAEKNSILEPSWLSSATATHMEGRLHLIRTGLYVGYLPTHYAAGWEQSGDLRRINPGRFLVQWPIYAVWRKNDEQSALVSTFLEDIKAASASLRVLP